MNVTHYGHACLLLEFPEGRFLFDPGTLSSGFEDLTGLDAILVSHRHPDHLDEDRIPSLLANNIAAVVVADAGSVPVLRDLGVGATVATPGEKLKVAGVEWSFLGGEHALVHRDLPQVPNVAYATADGAFYHPGDSFVVPPMPVDVLALPVSGPWLKVGESIDFYRDVAPRVAVPMHERALASTASCYAMLERCAPSGATFRPLEPGVSTPL